MAEPVETKLSWSDAIAGYWAISWPSWLIAVVIASVASGPFETETLIDHPWLIALPMQVAFLMAQLIWVPRLTGHNFRYFWIAVDHEGNRSRKLSWSEAIEVWWRLFLPQIAFAITGTVVFWITGWAPEDQALRTFNTLSQLAVILGAGPLGVQWAVTEKYGGFRLQAYARDRWGSVPAID